MKFSRIATVTLIAVAVLTTGCANTVRGVKRDVQGTANAAAN